MANIMKRILLIIALTTAIITTTGCQPSRAHNPKEIVTFQMDASSRGVNDFKKIFFAYYKTAHGKYYLSPYGVIDTCYNITPPEISKRYGFDIFKFNTSCSSFLLYENRIYPLGKWFGGSGVTSFAVADLNADGAFELFFTYSWGSGMPRSQVGYFDSANKEVVIFDFRILLHELVLKADDGILSAYTANDDNNSFVDMKLSPQDKVASIIENSGKLSLIPEN